MLLEVRSGTPLFTLDSEEPTMRFPKSFAFALVALAACDREGRDKTSSAPQTPTPTNVGAMDQGGSVRDRDISAQVRRELVADPNLSLKAKNVTIVTRDGVVTLKGPVASAEEKMAVASYAKRAAGPDAIDDRLEVYPN